MSHLEYEQRRKGVRNCVERFVYIDREHGKVMVWSLYKIGTDQDKPYDEMTIYI